MDAQRWSVCGGSCRIPWWARYAPKPNRMQVCASWLLRAKAPSITFGTTPRVPLSFACSTRPSIRSRAPQSTSCSRSSDRAHSFRKAAPTSPPPRIRMGAQLAGVPSQQRRRTLPNPRERLLRRADRLRHHQSGERRTVGGKIEEQVRDRGSGGRRRGGRGICRQRRRLQLIARHAGRFRRHHGHARQSCVRTT